MKDMYSFHLDQKDFENFYEAMKEAYIKIFKDCGLVAKVTEASGGAFSQKISYEFMVLTDAGEDDILYCENCDYCVNLEIAKVKEGDICPKCKKLKLQKARASEVGNVFDLGQKYTKAFDFYVVNEQGEKIYPIMGCYGLGTTRLMGVIVEKCNDEKGIIWPEQIAPFQVYLINIPGSGVDGKAKKIYDELMEKGIEVFWDDRKDVSVGEKFSDADLIGLPWRVIVSSKTGDKLEVKKRTEEKAELMDLESFLKLLQ